MLPDLPGHRCFDLNTNRTPVSVQNAQPKPPLRCPTLFVFRSPFYFAVGASAGGLICALAACGVDEDKAVRHRCSAGCWQ